MKHNCKFILKDDKGQIFNLNFCQKNPIKWTEVYLAKIQGALSKSKLNLPPILKITQASLYFIPGITLGQFVTDTDRNIKDFIRRILIAKVHLLKKVY